MAPASSVEMQCWCIKVQPLVNALCRLALPVSDALLQLLLIFFRRCGSTVGLPIHPRHKAADQER